MAQLFFSYSHMDEQLRNELEKHLTMLKREGAITAWHDRRIKAGSNIDDDVSKWLESSDIILLLVSPDFLASEYCYSVELEQAMKRHESGLSRVIPVILRPCDWHSAPFGRLLATPSDGRAVTLWKNQDEAFLEVARSIRSALESRKEAKHQNSIPPSPVLTPKRGASPRSSNLRVRKQFSDRNKDDFLHQSFEYIADYFAGSLAELNERNPDIESRITRHGKTFDATAYRDGKAVARCEVGIGQGRGFGDGITFSQGTNTALRGGINESLSVQVGEQTLSLKPMGLLMAMRGSDNELSQEGAAEYLWSAFIEPLQR